jgi:hypothetical protein
MSNRKWLSVMLILLGLSAWSTARAANLGILVDLLGTPSTGSPSAMEGGSSPSTNHPRVADTQPANAPSAPVGVPAAADRGVDGVADEVEADVGRPVAEPRRPARRGAKLRTLLPGSIR